MPIGTHEDFVVYEEQFQTGLFEVVEQSLEVFDANSNGAIIIDPASRDSGNFLQEAQTLFADGFTRRDTTSTADVSGIKLQQDEVIGPKISWRDGPYENTADTFKKIGDTPDMMAFVLGQQAGGKVVQAMVNSAAAGLRGVFAATNVSNKLVHTLGTGLTFQGINRGLGKFGDAQQRIVALLMHSHNYNQLVEDGLENYKIENVAGTLTIVPNVSQVMGRSIIVTDAPEFFDAGGSPSGDDSYNVYGLVQGAVRVKESEEQSFLLDMIGGKENIVMQYQSEGAYTISFKGMKFSTASENPTDTSLATGALWTRITTSEKSLPGVCMVTNA